MNLLEHLQGLFHHALEGLVAEPAPYSSQVKPAQNPQHGDYQANCAMAVAKQLGESKNTRGVAQKIIAALPPNDLLQPPEIAGPGFINLRLKNDWMAAQLQKMAVDKRLAIE